MGDTRLIYAVTHGEKFPEKPNPGMTEKGFGQVRALAKFLPRSMTEVVCATGRRHINVVEALNLMPTRVTAVLGGPDSLEVIGKMKSIVLADGALVDPELYTTLEDMAPAAKALIASLPDNSVLCVGRPTLIMIGHKDAKSGAVYRITCENGEIVGIDEVIAEGESEAGTV